MDDIKYQILSAISQKKDGTMTVEKELVSENVTAFLEKENIPVAKTYTMRQVHGNTVVYVNGKSPKRIPDADGLVTDKPNIFLAVTTADCIPLSLADQSAGVIGIAHAGYKGILEGVIKNFIYKALEHGAYANDIYISIGPSIGACCYDIDEERVKRFAQIFNTDRIFRFTEEKVFLDLKKAARILLEREGVPAKNITVSSVCTSCKNNEYFSYRKDAPETSGTFMTVIGMQKI